MRFNSEAFVAYACPRCGDLVDGERCECGARMTPAKARQVRARVKRPLRRLVIVERRARRGARPLTPDAARQRAQAAIRRGELVRPDTCERCGRATIEPIAHHEDYQRPLDVEWLCWKCHKRTHGRPVRVLPTA